MNDDELRNRLARLDPQADAPVDPITSPRAQDLLERTMSTDTLTETQAPAPRRNRLLLAATAGVAAAGIVAAVVITSGDNPAAPAKKTVLALKAPPGAGGPTTSMCIQFSVDQLKTEPVAFAGKATSVDASSVSLDVTKWYKGGTADVVTVSTPDRSSIALDGMTAFQVGKDYLVSAFDGTVVGCGFSGEDSAELRGAFEQAFG
jgi:hypothetical protein